MPQTPSSSDFAKSIGAIPASDDFAKSIGAKPAQTAPASAFGTIGDSIMDLATGALKSLGSTAMSVPHLAAWLADKSGTPLPSNVLVQMAKADRALAPSNASQVVGNLAGEVGQAFIPMTKISEAAKLAQMTTEQALAHLASNSPRLARAAGVGARMATEGAGQAGLAAAQGGDPTTAGAIGGILPIAGEAMSPGLAQGAEDSMVGALGPVGARGPAGKVALRHARTIAPDLLDQRFGAATQRVALDKAQGMLGEARAGVADAWAKLPQGATAPVGSVVDGIQRQQDALLIPDHAGTLFLPEASQPVHDALEQVKNEVFRLTRTVNGQEVADTRALRGLRKAWDDALNYDAANPAAGAQKVAYKAGANLVRASINGSDQAISDANDAYSQSEKLTRILKKSVDRPAPSIISQALRIGAPAAVVGALGYREGGLEGMWAGAIAGASISTLVSSPGWRYVAANTKKALADALESGDQTKTGQVLATVTSQMAAMMKAKAK